MSDNARSSVTVKEGQGVTMHDAMGGHDPPPLRRAELR